jgi:hypothetical protein
MLRDVRAQLEQQGHTSVTAAPKDESVERLNARVFGPMNRREVTLGNGVSTTALDEHNFGAPKATAANDVAKPESPAAQGAIKPPTVLDAATRKGLEAQARQEHAFAKEQYDQIAGNVGRIRPEYKWLRGKDGRMAWRPAGEYADIPKRWLDTNRDHLPKKPFDLGEGGSVPTVPGNADDVATNAGFQSEGDLLSWLANEGRTAPKVGDYIKRAIDSHTKRMKNAEPVEEASEESATAAEPAAAEAPTTATATGAMPTDKELEQQFSDYIADLIKNKTLKSVEQIDAAAEKMPEWIENRKRNLAAAAARPAPEPRAPGQPFEDVLAELKPQAPKNTVPDLGTIREGGGYETPANFKRFESDEPRDLQRPEQVRKNYLPHAHDVDSFQSDDAKGGIIGRDAGITEEANAANAKTIEQAAASAPKSEKITTRGVKAEDKNLLARAPGSGLLSPELQQQVIKNRLRTSSKAIAARDAERAAAIVFGKEAFDKIPPAAKAFFQETYDNPEDRKWYQSVGHAIKGGIDVPKHGLFAFPLRHMANIATLAILAGTPIFKATGKFGALLAAGQDAEKRAKVLGDAVKYGVTGAQGSDRDAGWTGHIPAIGTIYKLSNNILWAFDDAVKATRFAQLQKRYMRGARFERPMTLEQASYRAANEVGAELIDYGNKSKFTEALSLVAPFATYRSKVPGAIARSVAYHPERALLAGRVSPELIGDLQQQGDGSSGKVGKNYLPLADVLRGVDNPAGFARSTIGWPYQMALSAVGDMGGRPGNRYMTYGKPVSNIPDAVKYAINAAGGSFPGVSTALNKVGYGEFKPTDYGPGAAGLGAGLVGDFIRSQTGFGMTAGPNLAENRALSHVKMVNDQIEKLRASGKPSDAAFADFLQKRLDGYMKYHSLYQK